MKKIDVEQLISQAHVGLSRWELDNITWHERTTDSGVLLAFLKRIKELRELENISQEQTSELDILEELANDLDPTECAQLLDNDDDIAQQNFIEKLARIGAIEVLTNERISFETMTTTCKLSPNDFILCAKRTQDLINSIRELVIQGETLSDDVAGA
jgi:hypothetical protein